MAEGLSIPHGYCLCGCGQRTKPYRSSDRTRGLIKGEPRRYLRGHNRRKPEAKKVLVNKSNLPVTRCAGTRPDGRPCGRIVREDVGYCPLHDPYKSMVRKVDPTPIARAGRILIDAEYSGRSVDAAFGEVG